MRKLAFVFIVAYAFSTTAMAVDIAISTQAGWWGQTDADREMQEIADSVAGASVEQFAVSEQAALATWVANHTGDGVSDLLILCGQFPDSIYPAGNAQADGSLAELFLDDGNTIINTGDWMFYVVNGAGDNAAGGLENMMDIPGISMGDSNGNVAPTADGESYTPSVGAFYSERPWRLDELTNNWEPELILGQSADGTRADPVIVVNTVTGGRLGSFYQVNGVLTDIRGEVISEWINNWYLPIVGGAGGGNPFAQRPDPKDGARHEDTWISLGWTAGYYAVSHDVYMSDNFDDVNDGAAAAFGGNQAYPFFTAGFFGFPYPDGLVPGTTYYWRVDEVNDADPNSPWEGKVWSFWIPPASAHDPSPFDGAPTVDADVTLNWTAGFGAKLHTVYFGDDLETVTNAAGGPAQGTTTFAPGTLEADKTYYWRVDEFNPPTTIKGDVWSFKTLPVISITDPDLIGWWTFDEGGGDRAIDWSGHGNHGTIVGDPQWVGGIMRGALDLNSDYVAIDGVVDDITSTNITLSIWIKSTQTNQGDMIAANDSGSGHPLEFYIDGGYPGRYDGSDTTYTTAPVVADGEWHMMTYVRSGSTGRIYADGVQVATESASFDLAAIARWSIGQEWDSGPSNFYIGMVDDVRFYNKSLTAQEVQQIMRGDLLAAWNPSPGNNSTSDVLRAASVSWSAGDSASQHAVYFGTDRDAVTGAEASDATGVFRGLQAGTSYTVPGGVEPAGGPYYWRIDEHSTDGTVTKGSTWSFTVADYLIVDDFESYNDIPAGEPGSNLVYVAWVDGFDNPAANGSTMGYVTGVSLETGDVHGGNKSVPFAYNNTTAGVSEVVHSFAPAQDWTDHGIQTLSLWFFGDPTNAPGQLYVKINGVRANYDGGVGSLVIPGWQVWNLDLASVGANLQSVTSLAIGVEGSGATGILLLDDIGLYRSALVPPSEWRIAAGSDDAEEHVLDFGTMAALDSSDLELGYEGDMSPANQQTVGCRWAGIPIPMGATITEAWVQFSADEVGSAIHTPDVSVVIEGELSGNPATFSSNAGDISARPTTAASVVWDIPQWTTVHAQGPEERTPDISSVIQEMVNQNVWAGTIVLTFRDNPAKPSQGTREAESFDGGAAEAPLLHISYQ
ncbi:MAG: LamG domain-containing protein [Phycisphaerae bacterium]|nr:LamG domain-containing protein [Phycisphaerae bacterium]